MVLGREVASATKSGPGAILAPMTSPALDAEPACWDPSRAEGSHSTISDGTQRRSLRVRESRVVDIPRSTWDAMASRSRWATPFSGWAFHRAWWEAYGASAHEQTLVVEDEATDRIVAIVPLMHRHEVEPSDAETHTRMRQANGSRLTRVAPTAKAVFFGASYHADYATVLADPDDLAAIADAVVVDLAAQPTPDATHPAPWDVIDLRRLRCGDPAVDEFATAFGAREMGEGWTLNVEQEDVCPVLTVPPGLDFDGYLSTLTKKNRHEIRRKIRRAEAIGEIALADSTDPLGELDSFIDLHQRRWGADGLFAETPGGAASRLFFRRLFEESRENGAVRLAFLTVGGRRIAAGIHFRTHDGYLYYNAGVEPDARDLSPGVLMVAAYLRRAIAEGCRRFDFLRGNEPYKYEWGAVDEPIQRLLVRREVAVENVA
jgi:CelD/BcsL family acetyltransferase involved in cellulose biosynthesis